MSFLDNILQSRQSALPSAWKVLNEETQIDRIIEDSHQKPVAIFKHSIRCGTSAMAKFQLAENWDFSPEELDFYYLDLITYRPVSNRVTEVTDVRHQSPQVILLHKGQTIYNDSHHQISVEALKQALGQTGEA